MKKSIVLLSLIATCLTAQAQTGYCDEVASAHVTSKMLLNSGMKENAVIAFLKTQYVQLDMGLITNAVHNTEPNGGYALMSNRTIYKSVYLKCTQGQEL